MNYRYKKLGRADLKHFKALLKVFGEAFQEPDTYGDALPRDEYLERLLNKEDFIAIAALANSSVVGGLTAYILEKFEQERKEIYIYDLAVLETHRRKRIATTLIKNLQKIAKEKGAYVIFVQADPGDLPAIKLYESLGAREDVHHFDIPVE